MSRLADLLDRYGEAIAADLAMLPGGGWDIVELWRGGRFRFTLNLIDHLPRTSYFAQALSEDDEAAEEHVDLAHQDGPAPPPALAEWTPEVQYLAVVADRLAEVVHTLVAAHGGNPGQMRPLPRPVTALDRARKRREQELADKAMAKAFPHQFRKR